MNTESGPARCAWVIAVGVVCGFMTFAAAASTDPPRRLGTAVAMLRVETVAEGLSYPWSLVFLPNGDMLVSEKHPGRLRRIAPDGTASEPLGGLPPIHAEANGGLLGLALSPDFASDRQVFFAFSEPGVDGRSGLAVARATLERRRLTDVRVIYRQTPKIDDTRNFGGRIVFAPDGSLFVGTGDRFARALVQDRSNTIGALVRVWPDGSAPGDNPFSERGGTAATIWSFGHRNIEGAAVHPETGEVWIHELGPYGGDELIIPQAGANYGWPLVSWGRHYSGEPIPAPPTRPDLAASIFHWNPVISPSGMAFYTGDAIGAWRGNLLIGGLSSTDLIRLTLRGNRVISDERIEFGTRLRDVVQGPDGAVYLLTDEPQGRILRLTSEADAAALE